MTENLSSIAIQPCHTTQAFQEALAAIPCEGVLCQEPTGYVYLKVSEDFINTLLPLVELSPTQELVNDRRPDDVGAHISIVYPDEIQTILEVPDLGKTMVFSIQNLSLYTASVHGKSYTSSKRYLGVDL